MIPAVLDDGVICTDDSCDEVGDAVVNTANDANCDDGAFCNGAETCNAILDCQAGTPVVIDDGVACTDDSCDELLDVVVNNPNDANCDDTLFCNGAETCDPLLDCQAGIPPVLDDGVVCTDDSCDELLDVVVNNPNDANCDDTLWCNGAETCDPLLDCQAGVAPSCDDGQTCNDPDTCDEAGDTCSYAACGGDSDGDGLSDAIEDANCTSSSNPDTDGDGLCDGNLSVGSTCVAGEDMDLDAVVDGTETDPCDWDTDGDLLPDGYEDANSGSVPPLDPLSAADGSSDFDADTNANYHEYYNGSDPWSWDPVGGIGCESWGDGGGDGIPDPTDIVELAKAVRGLGPDYSNVLPTSGMGQDLDADGTPSPVDITELKKMVRGLSTVGMLSRPNSLVVLEEPAGPVAVGDTCHLTIGVLNDNATYSPAFGVIFEINAGSTGSATIVGGDGDSGSGRYDVSGDPGSSRVFLRIDSAVTIDVDVTLPGCGVPVVGRYCPAINLGTVTINP